MVKSVYFFGVKAFSISAIVTVKIIYSGFLASRINGVTPIIWISRVFSELWLSIVSYIGSSSGSGSVLSTYSALNLDLGSLSIFFIIEYQFFLYFRIVSLSFYLALGSIILRVNLWGLTGISDSQ